MPNAQQKALSAHRRRRQNGGMVRVEVTVPATDAAILRDLAAILRGEPYAARTMRNHLRSVVAKPPVDCVLNIFGADLPDAYFEGVFDQPRQGDTPRDVECWLRNEVIPVYDAMQADPGRGIPAEQVKAALYARHAERLKRVRRDA